MAWPDRCAERTKQDKQDNRQYKRSSNKATPLQIRGKAMALVWAGRRNKRSKQDKQYSEQYKRKQLPRRAEKMPAVMA